MALIPFLPPPALFSPAPTDGTDAGAVERLPGRLFPSRRHPRVAPLLLPLLLPRAGAFPAVPRAPPRPEAPALPPPRRRCGEPKPEAQLSIFRAPEHYKKPRTLFLSSFRQFPNPTPRNAAAAPQNAGELTLAVEPRLRSSSARADRLASSAVTSRSS